MKTKIIFTIIMALSFVGNVCVAAVNSNSKILDGIEYYVQTDKSTYQLGESVEMSYAVTNLGSQNVTFSFGQSPVWNFWAEKDGTQIWQGWWSGFAIITQLTLAPGESRQFPALAENPPFKWNLIDSSGNTVGAGNYTVLGGLYRPDHSYDYTKVSVPIEIIPEPATISFLLFSLPLFRCFERRKV